MGKFKKVFSIVLFSTLLVSCEEVETCSDSFLADKENLEEQFIQLHKSDSTKEQSELFFVSLSEFLKKHEDKLCEHDGEELNVHAKIKDFIASQKTQEKEILYTPEVVYGQDNRIDVDLHPNQKLREYDRSVATQIEKKYIDANFFIDAPTIKESWNLCPSERFLAQMNPGNCTGFLVEEDLIATAGHCMTSLETCEDFYWAFDFKDSTTQFDSSQIYRCKEIEKQVLDHSTMLDYALVRLDRPVVDRKPLRVRTSGRVSSGTPLAVIGNPTGLPLKIADGAQVRDGNNDIYFKANLDTFGGNSGSPVINTDTGIVEGILVRGETDYRYVNKDGLFCREVYTCADDGCDGEEVTRITQVDGITQDELLSYEDFISKLFKNPSDREELSFVFGMDVVKQGDYAVSSVDFLSICLVHIYKQGLEKEWIDQREGKCDDTLKVEIYNLFNELSY
ncbi:serine protease [Halobacteriovorax sp. GB3]|uniref:trypsin-like serine peptidase n=1 Tax=Halobacteriovorax sp. GB3 TaxID=2719615 RepID=UPI0023601248|nr:serine protease [Halobacteriovorax sp. GB3]MDD0853098.1 serine protease [Halobacteriovorax sp. GB3]